MEDISVDDIDFSQNIELKDKKIKGHIVFKDFNFFQAIFVNCVFERIFFSLNEQKKETYFQFTKCKINRIDINCFVDHICINDSQINIFRQEKGQTNYIEIYSDDKQYNKLNYLMLLNSNCRHLSLKNYDINTLTLQKLKVDFKLIIDDVTVYQNFSVAGCLIKNGYIVNIASKYLFSIANLDVDTDLFLGYANCETLQIIGKIRSSTLIMNEVKCQNLRFESLEVINSLMKLDNIQASKQLFLLESDFGDTYFVDCNFSKCKILISFPIVTTIKSLNLKFSDDIKYYTEFDIATNEKKIAELMEFYRQLKFNAITQHNHYNALDYYSKEMNWYFKSLKNLDDFSTKFSVKNKSLQKVLKCIFEWLYDLYDLVIYSAVKKRNPFEGFRIWVFKYTNNFGIDWIRPTLIYIVLSYLLFVVANESYEFTSSFQFSAITNPDFPRFLNPINKFSFSEVTQPNSFRTALAELFAIIIQGFLLYQLIRGFRKYVLK